MTMSVESRQVLPQELSFTSLDSGEHLKQIRMDSKTSSKQIGFKVRKKRYIYEAQVRNPSFGNARVILVLGD